LFEFYSKVFGWSFEKWDGPMEYWMIETGASDEPGINGGVMRRQPGQPAGTVNTVNVTSVDETIAAATAAGGTVHVPKMAVPGVGYMAYLADSDGNMFGVVQPPDEAAA
jgi:predicted enzyme related to lactoylglutathione lyase